LCILSIKQRRRGRGRERRTTRIRGKSYNWKKCKYMEDINRDIEILYKDIK